MDRARVHPRCRRRERLHRRVPGGARGGRDVLDSEDGQLVRHRSAQRPEGRRGRVRPRPRRRHPPDKRRPSPRGRPLARSVEPDGDGGDADGRECVRRQERRCRAARLAAG